ncbi:ABC-F family ATP-binding cassette domain-containing protein [bacterium]|nr:MAG: ABC-F family ATP-binding cassette domain-containing protein [bacterium]
MLQAIDLAVEFDRLRGPLFEGLRLSVSPGERVALVGPNGCGKSTLLRVLAGRMEPSHGHVRLSGGEHVAMLDQELPEDGTLFDHLGDDPALRRSLHRLGIPLPLLDRETATLSPGERMRALLARTLAEEPDILLLDEPTNHLDAPARVWLAEFLKNAREGVLIVTHDRAFADEVADRTLEIGPRGIVEVTGGYSDLIEEKQRRFSSDMERYENAKGEARRLKSAAEQTYQKAAEVTRAPVGQRIVRGSKPYYAAVQASMDKRAKAMRKRVDFVPEVEKPHVADRLRIVLPTAPLRSAYALQVRGLTKRYGERTLFEGIALDLPKGGRIALLGPNGAGKSTLMSALLDPELRDAGEVVWGTGARPALLSQTRTTLDPAETAVEALSDLDLDLARTLMGRLGLRGELQNARIGTLSVGERTRVELVRLLLSGANVLLLDEPTNHLDLPSLEALEEALESYEGALLFASHDRRFVERFAQERVMLGG